MASLYPGGRARLIPRRTSLDASRRSGGARPDTQSPSMLAWSKSTMSAFAEAKAASWGHSKRSEILSSQRVNGSSDAASPFVGLSLEIVLRAFRSTASRTSAVYDIRESRISTNRRRRHREGACAPQHSIPAHTQIGREPRQPFGS